MNETASHEPPIAVSQTSPTMARRHDLDALRAVAMLLGILLHTSLAFAPIPWIVKDSQQSIWMENVFAAIHGFRMPLFFLLSGFFTAMLWRRRGLAGLLRQRLLRIALPLVIGGLTIVPLMFSLSEWIAQQSRNDAGHVQVGSDLIDASTAIKSGDVAVVKRLVDSETFDVNGGNRVTTWIGLATVMGHRKIVATLIEADADVNGRGADGGSPLHAAAFLGRGEIVDMLIGAGAKIEARDYENRTALDVSMADWKITQYITELIKVPVEKDSWARGRTRAIESLVAAGAKHDPEAVKQILEALRPVEIDATSGGGEVSGQLSLESDESSRADNQEFGKLIGWLFYFPFFHHLWFLWFLCWLVGMFVFYGLLLRKWVPGNRTRSWVTTWRCLLWLIPLTMLPQFFMSPALFGADTSLGFLPFPSVLGYYAIFFFFGAMFFDCSRANDSQQAQQSDLLFRCWPIWMLFGLLVIFPITKTLMHSAADSWAVDVPWKTTLVIALQSIYVWLLTFGSMGMFATLCASPSKVMRYVSDSSYWLYLAHLPLVLVLQYFVKDWAIPVWPKFIGVLVVAVALLLISYHLLVRYTMIGTMLNGKRVRA